MSGDDSIYAVRPEEGVAYDGFCAAAVRQLRRTPPPTLWYYTSASTYAAILDSGHVWSTQISCLNDHTEFRHGVALIRKAMRVYGGPAYDEHTRWLANYIDGNLNDDAADYSWFFVFCLSEAKDDLSQWRAYGGGENGVSIGFDPARLVPRTQTNAFLTPVCYVEDVQSGLAADIAKWTMQYFKDGLAVRPGADRQKWADSFLREWEKRVIYFGPILKDKAFASENEWRLVVSLTDLDYGNIKIQQRQSLISRHLPISFGEKLPITDIVVGPTRHPSVSRVSVASYLKAKGYPTDDTVEHEPGKIRIASSAVPFQTT